MEMLGKKLMNWASILEDGTREQAERTASMPFVFPHVALMPDAHLGQGATIGSVIPTLGAVMPAAVGRDIGCGMIAVRTQFTAGDTRRRGDLAALREAVEGAIPLAAGNYNTSIYSTETDARVEALEQRAASDSAEQIAAKWWIPLPDPDLAYLVEGTHEFWDYIRDLRWAQHFALLNREEMMHRVIDCFAAWIGQDVEAAETVNTHHNYTAQEKHFGKDVWLSRKGAIDASAGVPGLIPGSMGTRSYVVTGKGNRLALNSAPHGAGREYSRSRARKEFTRSQLDAAMEGIEWRQSNAFLDEIPGAYKPIDVVMEDARDLVEIRHTLRQIVNVKGD